MTGLNAAVRNSGEQTQTAINAPAMSAAFTANMLLQRQSNSMDDPKDNLTRTHQREPPHR